MNTELVRLKEVVALLETDGTSGLVRLTVVMTHDGQTGRRIDHDDDDGFFGQLTVHTGRDPGQGRRLVGPSLQNTEESIITTDTNHNL